MVGDVKQSIYKFRLACPELFIEKYDTYGETGDNVRIELQKNFRSRENVLECANDVFSHIMNKNFSGIGYDESVRLNAGFPYPEYSDSNYGDEVNKSTDVILISSENEEEATTREIEADRLAKLIEGIVSSGVNVYDADENVYRPAEYRDIVILTRSVTGWADTFADALMDRGIPAYTDSSTGYFSVREIQVILSMLTIVDNPVQEISLAAAMMSYFGGFTAAELGMVRKLGREYVDKNVHNNLYEHLKAVAVLGEAGKVQEPDVKQLSGKCALFLAKLTEYRDKSSVESLYDLCWEMIYDSGYYDYVGTMPAGAQTQVKEHRRSITLDEAIVIARTQSVDAAVALNELKTAYWEYRTFRANLLPEMNLKATLPSYNKKYNSYQQEDGTYTYVRNNNLQMSGELSIDQSIWFTGGTLSLNSSLDFLKQLDGDKSKRYMSVPIALTLNQPIFGVNNIKWDRRIEPVRYAEAKASFLSATENVTRTTINYFFNLLLAKENVNIARQNLENAQKLHEVAKAKRSMGQISENDLLQLELNVLDARSTLTDNESTLKSRMFQLRSFLALSEDEDLEPVVPESIPSVLLNYDDVLDKALTNNSFAQNIRRRQLEADYEVAKAKGDLREITLYAQVGFTGTNNELNTVYHNLKDNQIVEVGFKIPILDWGKRRGKVKIAKSNRDVVESRLRQETMNFNQDLFILVEQFNNQQMQLQIANEADKIAEKRYNTNVETFMIGKISTLDLNDSQLKKDEARQKHINELYAYWSYYYQIRSLTLWDFTDNTGIDADFEKIIKQ